MSLWYSYITETKTRSFIWSEHTERTRENCIWVSKRTHAHTYTQTQTGDLGHSSMRLSYGWWMKPTHLWKTEQDHYDLGCKHTGEGLRRGGRAREREREGGMGWWVCVCVWSLTHTQCKPHMALYCCWISPSKGLDWAQTKRVESHLFNPPGARWWFVWFRRWDAHVLHYQGSLTCEPLEILHPGWGQCHQQKEVMMQPNHQSDVSMCVSLHVFMLQPYFSFCIICTDLVRFRSTIISWISVHDRSGC